MEIRLRLAHKKGLRLLTLIGIALTLADVAAAQGDVDAVANVYRLVEPAIVQLRVTGKLDGTEIRPRAGVACAFQTAGGVRLLTAKHVVGDDGEFDVVAGTQNRRQRDIGVTVKTAFGSGRATQTEHSIRAHPSMDLAEVFVQGADSGRGLLVSSKPIPDNSRVIVVTWPAGGERALPKEVRVLPRVAGDGPLIRLEHVFLEGDSGSPVLDVRGSLVAIIITRDTQGGQGGGSTLAVPIAEFKGWISSGYLEAESEEAARKRRLLAEKFDAVVAKMRESQIANAEGVFPALSRYKSAPTEGKWADVRDALRRSLEPIEEGIRLSIQYDAQLDPLAANVSAELIATKANFVDRTYTTSFSDVRSVWNGRFQEKQEILRLQGRLPSDEELSKWESDLRQSFARLSALLSQLSRQLMAQR